jgi:hypothetical protein
MIMGRLRKFILCASAIAVSTSISAGQPIKVITGKIFTDGQHGETVTKTFIKVQYPGNEEKVIQFQITKKTRFINKEGKKKDEQVLDVHGIFGTYVLVKVSFYEKAGKKTATEVRVIEIHEGEGG